MLRILTRVHSSRIIRLYLSCIHSQSYAIFMHLGSEEEITLLDFEEAEEGDQQENPQAAAPEGVEQNPEELSECPDHRPTSFLKGKPRSILSLPVFYK